MLAKGWGYASYVPLSVQADSGAGLTQGVIGLVNKGRPRGLEDWGALVENLAGEGEYHWMDGNFIKYGGPLAPEDLPVDAHELLALCAPRPVFVSTGTLEKGDGWVDPKGMFLAAVAAGPVYELLGARGLGTDVFPAVETPLIGGDVAFRQHAGGHTPAPNWPTFIEFAGRYFETP